MTWKSFSAEVPGKWVLAGEHAVLRGGKAVALPHPELKLKLEFRPSDKELEVDPPFASVVLQELLTIGKQWLGKRGVSFALPRGNLKITSTIPFGAGFGSSAALSVATSRWLLSAYSIDRSFERELAREMEDLFHGQSSGMDISVVSLGEPILFSMKDGAVGLGLQHLPFFHFTDTGLRASTKECIDQVNAFRMEGGESVAQALDAEMGKATEDVLTGLRAFDEAVEAGSEEAEEAATQFILHGMNRAHRVFESWGLVPNQLDRLFQELREGGYGASRLTGKGRGGFIVSLKASG